MAKHRWPKTLTDAELRKLSLDARNAYIRGLRDAIRLVLDRALEGKTDPQVAAQGVGAGSLAIGTRLGSLPAGYLEEYHRARR